MHRSPLGSAFAAVMLLWFALITAEPAVLHSCPVHSGASSPHGSAPSSHGAGNAAADEHAGHEQHSPVSAHPSQSHDGDTPDQHRCACIGDCSSGPSASGLPAASASPAAAIEWAVRHSVIRDESVIVTAPAFLRPFANGPPAGHRIA